MNDKTMTEFDKTSYLTGNNAAYIEDLFEQFLNDPNSVDEKWRQYFTQNKDQNKFDHHAIQEQLKYEAMNKRGGGVVIQSDNAKQEAVDNLIHAYRRYGHFKARIDPLGFPRH